MGNQASKAGGRSGTAPLSRYRQKRDFAKTPEPADKPALRTKRARGAKARGLSFVIQKHWARQLHYDFRLELDGVLLSWAVPKGPSYDPADKRMAVHVEDHPVDYGGFEGTIPPGQYGAGTVIVWDRGTWEPVGEPREGLQSGKLVFRLHGEKLAGLWELVRISKADARQDQWILFKKRDERARPRPEFDVISALPDSVVTHPLGPIEARQPVQVQDKAKATSRGRRDPSSRSPAAEPGEPDLAGATKAPLPPKLSPQLATLVAEPPMGAGWVVEPKFDGYRILARIEDGKARLFTRGGHDWTSKMKPLAGAVQALGIECGWIDGEIVVMNQRGVPDFNALQNALDNRGNEDIVYFVFDSPYLDGWDLRRVPLSSRRELLRRRLDRGSGEPRVRFSQDFEAPPLQMLDAARRMDLEGIMMKRLDAPYVSARSETWLKVKCSLRQEFVVCGFTDRSGSETEVGGLLLGYYEDGRLRYAGNVGTGWDARSARSLHARLVKIETDEPPVNIATIQPARWSKRSTGRERWVKPEVVVEIEFAAWTPDGHLRHPSFKGVRADKAASGVTRESAVARAAPAATGPGGRRRPGPAAKVKISNPERVIDPATGLTKLDLVRYYQSMADRLLPHLKNRPVSLVRAPEGISGELFFQKHPESRIAGMTALDPSLWPGHAPLLAINDEPALMHAAQMNMVELHTWNSTIERIDKPDRIVFDLDPGEGVAWAQLQEAALLTRALLSELELRSWLKTSGGKGLHLIVPLAPRLEYRVVKNFSQTLVQHLARTIPSRFVAKSGPSNRVGKIFVDYIRNGHAQTTATAFSARARPGLGVSMPVDWDQLMSLKNAAQWTIRTAREYLSFQQSDPWSEFWAARQSLTSALKILGVSDRPDAAPRQDASMRPRNARAPAG